MSECYSSLLLLVVSSVLPTILEFGAPKSWFNFSKYLETPSVAAFKSSYARNVASSFGSIQLELHRIVVMKVEMCKGW